jgi:hypothetical protein
VTPKLPQEEIWRAMSMVVDLSLVEGVPGIYLQSLDAMDHDVMNLFVCTVQS